MKRINIITALLLIYLLVMSYIGWRERGEDIDYPEYFLVVGGCVIVIFLLRYLRIRFLKKRDNRFDDNRKRNGGNDFSL
jgi:Na+/proline symporter